MNIKQTPAAIEYQKEITEGMFGLMSMVKKHQEMIDNYVSDSFNTQLEDLPGEIWGDIEGYEGKYQISTLGRVKSLKRWSAKSNDWFYRTLILKPKITHRHYLQVGLSKNCEHKYWSVHRLVAIRFIPVPQELLDQGYTIETLQVNHKDENPKNNHVENLEWCTHEYNQHYGTITLRKQESGSIPVSQFDEDGYYITSYPNSVIAASVFNGTDSSINPAIHGKYYSAYGYFWRQYKPEHKPGYRLPENEIVQIKKLIPVSQFDKDGKWLANYENILQASKILNTNANTIYNCIYRPNIAYSAAGYIWKRYKPEYKENYILPDDEIPNVGLNNEDKAKQINIIDITTNEIVNTLPSIQGAARFLHSDKRTIKKKLRQGGIYRRQYRLEFANKD